MKRTIILTVAALAAGCARPVYVVKSDAAAKYIHGGMARLSETYLEVLRSAPDSTILTTVTVIEYNRAGNITLEDIFQGPDSIHSSRREYHYDPSGERIVRHVERNPVRNTFTTTLYDRDAQGRLIRERGETQPWRVDYDYDRHGYLKTMVDSTNVRPLKIRYRYDRLGRLRKAVSIRGGEPTKRYAYHGESDTVATVRFGKSELDRYDRRGNLVSTTSYVVYKRNKRGHAVSVHPVTLTADYDYDRHGNWIRRTQRHEGRPVGIALREIRYYGEGDE